MVPDCLLTWQTTSPQIVERKIAKILVERDGQNKDRDHTLIVR